MKKNIVFAFVAALVMAACTNQETIETAPAVPTAKTAQSNTRSYDEALKIAENAIGMLEDSKSTTRSGESCRKIDLSENKVIMRDAKTRGESDGSDSLIYVFNFENNEGFALVSASKNTEGLLAVTEQGHCDPETPSGIDGFDEFLSLAKEYVLNGTTKNVRSGGDGQPSEIVSEYTTKGPYVSVKWGQGTNKVEGEFFSNKIPGCVNVAIAQIMTYYEYPSSIQLTYEDADVDTQSLPWADMRMHNNGNTHTEQFLYGVCNNNAGHAAISRLIRQIGVLDNSYPDGDETFTLAYYINPTISLLGYNVAFKTTSDIRSELDNSHLLLVTGSTSPDEAGHAWVLDGYKKEVMKERLMESVELNGHTVWIVTEENVLSVTYYNHFNWGAYGSNNGYFNENVYSQSYVLWPDNSLNPLTSNYQYNLTFRSIYR